MSLICGLDGRSGIRNELGAEFSDVRMVMLTKTSEMSRAGVGIPETGCWS